jgi:precorrin-6A/cobalt-precorrin-6A reductase
VTRRPAAVGSAPERSSARPDGVAPSPPRRILILGGTAEAAALAARLHAADIPAVTSLAGRVDAPRLPPGEVRTGGFGGAEGLARWLDENRCAAVVDATHPFATRMAAGAATACADAGLPLLRLERPGWTEQAGDRWQWVPDVVTAARAVPGAGRRVLLALGSRQVAAFAHIQDVWFVIRAITAPQPPLPPHHVLCLDRGPFTLASERELLRRHAIDALVTRDSGGEATAAKLTAARELSLPAILIRRPPRPAVPAVTTVADAVSWARTEAARP